MNQSRVRRHKRIRKKIAGTPLMPRMCVFRSPRHMTVQFIDDQAQQTLLTCSTVDKALAGSGHRGNVKTATQLGTLAAERAKMKGIERVIFDRGGYQYHGRVKALAEAARKGGLQF